MSSGITQLRGIIDPAYRRLLQGIQKFAGLTSTDNFADPLPPIIADLLLLESGDRLLLEDGSEIGLE